MKNCNYILPVYIPNFFMTYLLIAEKQHILFMICTLTSISLHEKLFRSQANQASKPSKSTSPNFILLARKK